ncbi:MAG: OadG family protein [Synergistaceae bacterium]|nr:OadG family protein [Synergistaceae bacterium]
MTEIHSQISESGIGGAFTLSIIAFTIVFLVLGGLSGIIYGIQYLAMGVSNKKDASGGGKPQSAPPAPVQAAPAAPAPSVSAATPDRGRLLAVLTAAIAAAEGKIPVIRSVTRAISPRGTEEWKRMGIIEGHCTLSRNWK